MDRATQATVRARAKQRCEYCHFPEAFAELPFHFDHIIAEQHGGPTQLPNLALACCFCNRYKGPNVAGVDPATGKITPLFHPRQQVWRAHFRWSGARLIGLTPEGRSTVDTLKINRADTVIVRDLLMREGVYPVD